MNSTAEVAEKVSVKRKVDTHGPMLADLSEQMAYVLGVIQDHAEVINNLRSKVDQMRGRMGL